MRKLIYKILEIPFFYRVITGMLGPGGARLRRKYYQKVFNQPAQRILDLGCGPALTTPVPGPQTLVTGVDVNESYLRHYTGGFLDKDPGLVLNPPPARYRLGFLSPADHLPFSDALFDEARSNSFFHHLTDVEVDKVLKEVLRCLQPGGRMVMFDAVWPRRTWARPLAWLILRMDRGTHMRNEAQLTGLFKNACPGDWKWERFTYTYTGLECLCLQYVKPRV